MQPRPLPNQAGLRTGESAVKHAKTVDGDLDLLAAIARVEMWRRVIVEEHRNENPVKPAEFKHPLAAYSRRRPSPELLVTIW